MKKGSLLFGLTIFCVQLFGQTVPTGFFMSDVSTGATWNAPVGAAFTTDGLKLFVWEKDGRVYVCNRQASGNYAKQSQAVLNISDEVGGWRDFGLLGFALDPSFASNGFIYVLYVVDRHHLLTGGLISNGYNAATNQYFNATIGRVTRYTTTTSGGNLVAIPSSRQILVGESISTGMAILHESHGIGGLVFAADGTLLISCGDGASYNIEDPGSISHTYFSQALTDGIIRPDENVGAFRSQMLNSHSGKLLRINPANGDGVSSNPFFDGDSPRSAKSRVWAFGFRNPFRISIKPGTGSNNPSTGDIGEVFVGDVGWGTWEELNVVKAAGSNFGWPLYEGLTAHAGYMAFNTQNGEEPNSFGTCSGRTNFRFKDLLRQDNEAEDKSVYNPCNASQLIGTHNRYIHKRPSIDWRHGQNVARVGKFDGGGAAINPTIGTTGSEVVGTPFGGNCTAGGVWYTGAGNSFPAEYKNTLIIADYGGTWIRRLTMDFTDVVTKVDNFATNIGAVVCLAENPVDGSLVCVNVASSTVRKMSFGGNIPPVAKIKANNYYTPATSLMVSFDGTASFDQDGSIASYAWNFGDPTSASNTSNSPTPNHQFNTTTGPKMFNVTLTVTDNGGVSRSEQFVVSINNTPPNVNITSPLKDSKYKIAEDTTYLRTATVSDNEHSAAELVYEWQTTLVHNNHIHPEATDASTESGTVISRIGCNGDTYYWLIKLKVTDAAGLFAIDSAKLFPDCLVGPVTPTVSSVSPVNGATGISLATPVTATFNQEIDASTVNGTTVHMNDAANNVVAATITVNAASDQIILTPSTSLAPLTVYTVTIEGGASGIKNMAGNSLTSDYQWSFTTVAVPAVLSGTVVLQGRPAAPHVNWEVPIHVDLYAPGNNITPAYSYNVTTNQNGIFTINDIPLGTYTIAVKNTHTLKRVKSAQAISGGNNNINFGTLLEGDGISNNSVDIFDLSLLANCFGKSVGQPGYDARVDFNNDSTINIFDLSLLATNFFKTGETP